MSDQRLLSRRNVLKGLAAAPGIILLSTLKTGPVSGAGPGDAAGKIKGHLWGYAVDTRKCIGCYACVRACSAENDVPAGFFRTWVERYRVQADGTVSVDIPSDPDEGFQPVEGDAVKAFFVPKICNHCAKSVCNQVCPVGAAYTAPDGVVLVDDAHCIGCGYCVQACPYGTRFIHPVTHHASKCTLCYHRITRGLQPACVMACPTGARMFGDLNDPDDRLSIILQQRRYRVLRPEMGTHPRCYYLGLDAEVI
ncbi:4Fe-4S dicluster domain-containing protein [bacterium]|nr:4Fe-4S dicluster domain-containing protein [candidate division CSSED10-310 bacterium]